MRLVGFCLLLLSLGTLAVFFLILALAPSFVTYATPPSYLLVAIPIVLGVAGFATVGRATLRAGRSANEAGAEFRTRRRALSVTDNKAGAVGGLSEPNRSRNTGALSETEGEGALAVTSVERSREPAR